MPPLQGGSGSEKQCSGEDPAASSNTGQPGSLVGKAPGGGCLSAVGGQVLVLSCPGEPPPVVVTFPGPILSSFPQQAVVGSSGAPAFGGSLGLGGLYGAGATLGSGGLCTFGRPYASPACSPCALPRYSKKLWDTCGPC
ncbi:PREDICTED: scale keratin-like [Nipponia nippon]|uniref:scale keratin-like n=1 Tax=Nipponia nippon TaxID=128390 RepID=UPI000510FECB|nr:PREDICTED: scale keratin-like [Nipponia nippon]